MWAYSSGEGIGGSWQIEACFERNPIVVNFATRRRVVSFDQAFEEIWSCVTFVTSLGIIFEAFICVYIYIKFLSKQRLFFGFENKMRGVTAFLVWLFSIWTWFKASFRRRWFKTPPLEQAILDTSSNLEQLPFYELALSSQYPKNSIVVSCEFNDGILLGVRQDRVELLSEQEWVEQRTAGGERIYSEFLRRIASSDFRCAGHLSIHISDSVNSWKYVDDLVEALLCNTNFESIGWTFAIDKNTYRQPPRNELIETKMAECVSRWLLGNDVIQALDICFISGFNSIGKRIFEPLAKALCKNRGLKKLTFNAMDGNDEGMEEQVQVLVKPLKDNDSVLESLTLYYSTDVALEHLGAMLCTNTSLKKLYVRKRSNSKVWERGFTSLRDALCCNKTLIDLGCSVMNSVELRLLLEPLTSMNKTTQANTTLTSLSLYDSLIGEEGVLLLKHMLQTETSKLLSLSIDNLNYYNQESNPYTIDYVVAILEAVETNKSLKEISFLDCRIGGHKVLGALMDLLLHNPYLEDINLIWTGLNVSGDDEYVYTALTKRRNVKLGDVVQRMADVNPQAGRVFLCGNGHAGKTTLRKSIMKTTVPDIPNGSQGSNQASKFHIIRKIFPHQIKSKVTKVERTCDLEISPILERTRGIEVDKLHSNGIDISIWDMAGQTEYHSFHDLVVPNLSADGSCSLYLVLCNPTDPISSQLRNVSHVKSEITYWLQFIASNTRRSLKYRPHVSLVFTHFDIWSLREDGELFTSQIEKEVQALKDEFQEVLEFDKDIFQVNGNDVSDAEKVFQFIKKYLGDLLERLPKTIKACVEVQRRVAEWNMELSKDAQTKMQSLLQWKEFCDNFCNDVEDLEDDDEQLAERKKLFVAISLHDRGHIMYHEESKFVITDPHWFCHDIMGEFLHYCSNLDRKLEIVSEHGIVTIDDAHTILLKIILKKNISDSSRVDFKEHPDKLKLVKDILSMMEKLHICYTVHDQTIIVPSTLKDNLDHSLLHWSKSSSSTSVFLYVGRRFICKDVMRTMLSPGFFPRLQVSFFKKFEKSNCGNSYELLQDVIKFIYDGIEVIIQFSNGHLDILLRFEQSCEDKMLDLLERIVMHIKELLSNSTLGCPGVIIVEHILRPKCVEELIDCKDRKDQFVSIEDLELAVITRGFAATYNWKPSTHFGTDCDRVSTLMGKHAWRKLLQRRFKVLQAFEKEIVSANSYNNSLICPEHSPQTTSRWWSPQRLVEQAIVPVREQLNRIEEKVDVIDRKIDVVLQLQKNIQEMQQNLLYEVSSRINDVITFSIRMEGSRVPKLAYLTETGKRQIFMQFVPGLVVLQLHLMCESQYQIHEVGHQRGYKVKFGTEDTRRIFTMMVWGLNIATILTKIGAHVAGGMGAMVPNFGEYIQLAGLILDTPNLLQLPNVPNAILETWPDDVKRSPKFTIEEKSKAQQWLIGLIEPMCSKDRNNFHALFKLNRVVYKETQSIAWICDDCVQNQKSEIDIL